jgi:hypothetical protein
MASQHHYNSDLEAEGWLKRERTLTDIRYNGKPKRRKILAGNFLPLG